MTITQAKTPTLLKVLIWITILTTLLGQLFKNMYWPGASLLLMLGTFVFCFFYLPLYFIEARKNKETTKAKISIFVQTLILFLFGLGFLFKIMHWPGAGFLYLISNFILVFVVIPFSFYFLIKNFKKGMEATHLLFLAMYFFAYSIGTLNVSSSGKININSVLVQGINTETAYKASVSRNKHLYTTISQLNSDSISVLKQKSERLKTLCDTTITYLQDLKAELLSVSENVSKAKAESLNVVQLRNPNSIDVPQVILFEKGNPKTNRYSAFRIKVTINAFQDSLLNLIQPQNRAIIKEGLNLSTENYENEYGEIIPWEEENFMHTPVLSIINSLSNIKYEIKNAEYQALTDLINSNNLSLNSALMNKITELNSSFDNQKKQEQINKLQDENMKREMMLSDKDEELDNSKQAIVIFVLITMLFLVMVFFIIRSNYLRKQANIALSEQKKIIEHQKEEAENQKHVIEEKQKEILDSISYAKRLQEAILPPQEFINTYIPQNFVLYQPKDIVAGDFYWAEHVGDLFFIAAADSTGHGVPGAMVSVVCSNALNRTVKEFNITDTGKILDKTRELVLETFSKSTSDVKDGMDISLLCIDRLKKQIYWSGANNPLWYVQPSDTEALEATMLEIKADKQPIGKSDHAKPFTTHQIEYKEGTLFYLFTDGMADQFGGPKGKKYKYNQMKELLLSLQNKSMSEQAKSINASFNNWKGSLEQVDDVCIIGVKL